MLGSGSLPEPAPAGTVNAKLSGSGFAPQRYIRRTPAIGHFHGAADNHRTRPTTAASTEEAADNRNFRG